MLSSVTVYVNVWAASSAPPPGSATAKPATVCGPESSFTVWSAPSVNEGSSFTEFTVIVKVSLSTRLPVSSLSKSVPPESVTKTVTVELPLASAVSVSRRTLSGVGIDRHTSCEEPVVVVRHPCT